MPRRDLDFAISGKAYQLRRNFGGLPKVPLPCAASRERPAYKRLSPPLLGIDDFGSLMR